MGMQEQTAETAMNEESSALSRRGLFVSGGLLAAGLSAFGAEGIASAPPPRRRRRSPSSPTATPGSFWSVFKAGVDQATKDMKGRGINVTQVYANNDVSKQVSGINAAIASKVERDRDLRPGRERAQGSAHEGVRQGHRDHHGQLGRGRVRQPPTYDVHVGQDEKIAGEGAGKQFNDAGAKEVVVIIHEASNSGLTDRADGRQVDVQGHDQDAPDPERQGRHPRHGGQDQGLLHGQQEHRCAARPRPRRDGPGPAVRPPARRWARSTSTPT